MFWCVRLGIGMCDNVHLDGKVFVCGQVIRDYICHDYVNAFDLKGG